MDVMVPVLHGYAAAVIVWIACLNLGLPALWSLPFVFVTAVWVTYRSRRIPSTHV